MSTHLSLQVYLVWYECRSGGFLVSISPINEYPFSSHLASMDPAATQESILLQNKLDTVKGLIQAIIRQINGGNLSAKAAKFKVLVCLAIIQDYQLTDHPDIKEGMHQLHSVFEQMFGTSIEQTAPYIQPTHSVSRGKKMDYYINLINDTQTDAMYSDNYQRPTSLLDIGQNSAPPIEDSPLQTEPTLTTPPLPSATTELSQHYLSHVVSHACIPPIHRKKNPPKHLDAISTSTIVSSLI
jgi:hypothetical protein